MSVKNRIINLFKKKDNVQKKNRAKIIKNINNQIRKKYNRILFPFYICLIAIICIQFCVWFFFTKNIKHNFTITPLPPSKLEMSLFSFGDSELLYRFYGFKLQTAGDTFGETIALQDYDYEKLEQWFYALDELDGRSEYVPSIAGFYYSVSQHAEDNKHIVSYLEKFADRDPVKNWRWYVTATYIAKYKLYDNELSFRIARKLMNIDNKEIPFVSRIMSIAMLGKKDLERCETINMINDLLKSGDWDYIVNNDEFSSPSGKNYYLFRVSIAKIEKVIKNKQLIKKCLSK